MTADQLARRFHETYERLAPSFGYETRKASAVPWAKVPEKNKRLMTAVCAELLAEQFQAHAKVKIFITDPRSMEAALQAWLEGRAPTFRIEALAPATIFTGDLILTVIYAE